MAEVYAPFSVRLYAFTLSKLVDGNFAGLDLFYRIKECWKGWDSPRDLLIKPQVRGLPFKIGEWCFEDMTSIDPPSESRIKAYYLTLEPEDLVWYLEVFTEGAIKAGVDADDDVVKEIEAVIAKANKNFEGFSLDNEQLYWDFIEGKARTKLRNLYRSMLSRHKSKIDVMKKLYAQEVGDRIIHDRQFCAFISQTLIEIGFDGEDVDGLPQQWVKREYWPVGIKDVISARDRGKCAHCGTDISHELSAKAHLDHIIPISRGGCNDVVNLQLLCTSCNSSKSNKDASVASSVPRYIGARGKAH